jgi:dihydrofolate reductase
MEPTSGQEVRVPRMEVIYYVAMSLDGYIAAADGGVEWLEPYTEDHGYQAFYDSIDALLMGSRTYEQVLTFGAWPYPGVPCWVFSQRPLSASRDDVFVTDKTPEDVLAELEAQDMRRVWLVGGAGLASSFRDAGLITEYVISVIPNILGDGIPLFSAAGPMETLRLVESVPFEDGIVQLRYRADRA